jgi:hypothetical protein
MKNTINFSIINEQKIFKENQKAHDTIMRIVMPQQCLCNGEPIVSQFRIRHFPLAMGFLAGQYNQGKRVVHRQQLLLCMVKHLICQETELDGGANSLIPVLGRPALRPLPRENSDGFHGHLITVKQPLMVLVQAECKILPAPALNLGVRKDPALCAVL